MARDVRDRLSSLTLFHFAILLTALLLTACNSGTSSAPPAFVMIEPGSDRTLVIGETLALTSYWSTGPAISATWTSSAPAVASISASGTVTAVAEGSSTIKAEYQGKTDTLTVTVSGPAAASIASISVTPSSPSIATGATQQFTATGTYSDSTTGNITAEVTWTSSATTVASVSNDEASRGLASGLSAGTANITATLGTVTSPAATLTVTQPAAVLSASMSALTLSVLDPSLNAALTGTARTLQITNTSAVTATALNLASQNLPAGTTFSSTCGITLAPSATCEIEVAPGSTPSAAPGVTSASGATLTVTGSNTNTLSLAVNVLTYGSVFQGGYVFSIDDTSSVSESIAGQIVGLTDRSTGVQWSATSDEIYGINVYSTPLAASPASGQLTGMNACNGAKDGACNSTNIKVQYAASASTDYATGVCTGTSDGYSDWYLPAICQLGYDTSHTNYACGFPTPVMQNVQSSLVNNGNIGSLSGQYWSSTQLVSMPLGERALAHTFAASPIQSETAKTTSSSVRCVRDLTE